MYKTILVHVDQTARSAQRVDAASRLACQFEGHLVGVAVTGLSAYMFSSGDLNVGMPPIVFPIEELRDQADRLLDAFDKAAGSAGVHSFERRMVDDDAESAMILHARYSDLVVISQSAPDEFLPRLRSDFPEFVLLNSSRPVLVLPHQGAVREVGRNVTVAWNGSAEALRAITTAIPLLKRAARVDLVVFDGDADSDADAHGDTPGADMALYLARHGIKVTVTSSNAGGDDGAAVLNFAAERDSDLIVMGAFGHSRFREFLLGGMTRTALSSSPIALWMAH